MLRPLRARLREASGPGFKSGIRQLVEMTELLLRGHVHPSEYFAYGFGRSDVTRADMARFLGNHTHWLEALPRLNHPDWRKLTTNKWFFQLHFQCFGPLPRAYGVFHPLHGVTTDGHPLAAPADLERLVTANGLTGFVAKPVEGWKGEGVIVVREVLDDGTCLAQDGTRRSLGELAADFASGAGGAGDLGVLLQERLVQSEEMDEIARDGTHTIRIVTVVESDGGIHIPSSTLKMGRKGSMVDNWSAGATVSFVDPDTGRLGPGRSRASPRTPDERFTDMIVPRWSDAVDIALRLARAAPGLRSIAWDMIMTGKGPRVIEGNDTWDVVGQQSMGHRFLEPRMAALLREAGVDVHSPELPPIRPSKALQVLRLDRPRVGRSPTPAPGPAIARGGRSATSLAVALTALLAASCRDRPSARPAHGSDPPRLAWVATARQLGVVGYRDPVGAVSPDGALLAYAEGRHLRVVPVRGGPSRAMTPALGQVRHLAWLDASTVLAEDRGGDARWWRYDAGSGEREPLWAAPSVAAGGEGGARREIRLDELRELAPSPDGSWVAGTALGPEGWELWRIDREGADARGAPLTGERVSAPAVSPAGEIACVIRRGGRDRLHLPCDGPTVRLDGDVDVVGPLAFSPDGAEVWFASPDGTGMVGLWRADLETGAAGPVVAFARDTYAPSVAADGSVAFRTQSYRTFVAEVDVTTGAHRQLALFQSETPSYHPDGTRVGVTFGTWRRQLDDANYPDIAQHIGLVPAEPGSAPAAEPVEVIAASASEDQAMHWSPDGAWIALHSHREGSDDIWLRPADGSAPDRRITFLGRGAEVGWPRWSPDGRTVLLDGASPVSGQSVLFVLGVDPSSGEVTSELREIPVSGLEGDITHGEWLPDSRTVVAIAREGPGRHAILSVGVEGGAARVIHRFASEHDFPGLAVSPDGREVGFIAPAPDGFHQVFRRALSGGAPVQVTRDPSDKTQPAWSPDGRRIAYTVWDYRSWFWRIEGAGGDAGG